LPAFGEPTSIDPVLKDPDYVVQKFVSGIENSPTTMAFVSDDILVLQKTDGKVRLIRDGALQTEPVLDVSVRGFAEQGMLGITVVDSSVYLYFTEANEDGGVAIANKIYRYDWNGEKLVNPVLVKTLPGKTFYHNGGAMVTGSDGSVYAVIGDQGNYGLLQNRDAPASNDTSVILRIEPKGPYYAMGIRNSFGLAIDPVTGNLWDTENGDDDFDEVNFVQPKSNSGWDVIMGPANETELAILPGYDGYVYSDPEFSWQQVVAPTAIAFIDSKPLEKFKNNMFVGDCIYGNLYKFELNPDRTGFGCLTDIEVGPDGLLYVLSLSEGTIYKIMPKTMTPMDEVVNLPPEHSPIEYAVYAIIAALIVAGIVIYLTKVRRKSK
jgi:glucose/arabinose dehydrogenase